MAGDTGTSQQQDLLFAQLAVKKGFVQSQQLESAFSLQRELSTRGEQRRLSSLLIQTGDMTTSQVRELLTEIENNMLPCPGCGSIFNVSELPPGKKFLCKRCKTVVVVPDPGTTPTSSQNLAQTVIMPQDESVTAVEPESLPDGLDPMIGVIIGGCKIVGKLGAGGMGTVYHATQISLGRPVALKILPQTLAANEEYIARFEREARAVALLNHPNIVQVHDMGKDKDTSYFIVMEFVDGTTLSDLWKEKGVLDEKFALRVVRQACSGLHAAHDAGILHRDIKPENLMISKDGRVKITDFGLAKETQGDSQLTGTGIALGTPAYMAPEQGMGETPDRRSDVYSLGGTLFTLLTGRLPYEAKSPLSMMMKHATDPVPRVREFNTAISEGTENLILTAMAKAPEERFDDMNTMRDSVQTSLDNLSSQRTPASAKAPERAPETPTPKTPRTLPASHAIPKKHHPPKAGKHPPLPETKPDLKARKRGPVHTPKAPHKAVSPARHGRAPHGKGEAATRSGARKAGKKHLGATKSGRMQAMPRKSGSGKIIALSIGGLLCIGIIVGVILLVMNQKKNPGRGDTDTQGQSKREPADVSKKGDTPGEKSEPGEKSTSPPTDPVTDPPNLPPGADEPEGPIEPPTIPKGIKKGTEPGEYINEKDGSILVYVPAGRILVGLNDQDLAWIRGWFPELERASFEKTMPTHSVYLDGFFIGKYEITNGQYETFIDWYRKNPADREKYAHPNAPEGNSPMPGKWKREGYSHPDAPVVDLDWFDAWAYAHWAGLDLPTEAQWEKAALWDPAKRERRRFPWGERVDSQRAQTCDAVKGDLFSSYPAYWRWLGTAPPEVEKKVRPVPVRAFPKDVSPVGAVGMAGNVAEWCRDFYAFYFFHDKAARDRNAYNAAFYPGRVVRGGHFRGPLLAFFPRRGYRAREDGTEIHIGSRVAKTLVSFPEDVPSEPGEAQLRALPLPMQRRTVMGLLESMKKAGNWNGVVMRAKWALDAFPEEETANFYNRLAWGLIETNKINDAIYYLETGMNLEKHVARRADFHYAIGRARRIAGDSKGAFDAFNKSVEVNPQQVRSNFWRGKYLLEVARDFNKGIETFLKCMEYTYQDVEDYTNCLHGMGLCKKGLKDTKGALEAFNLAIAIRPHDAVYNYDRGDLLGEMGQWDDAKKDFEKCIERKFFSRGYLGLTRYYEAKGKLKEAQETAQQGLRAGNTCGWAYDDLRELWEQIKKKRKEK
ncbi:MAG: protein kinase domain-containing protein [Planctomycetota bacterium]|jgi:serine/threonine protein kinase/formylglycine-generating enzyme required for sulfatase activity